MGGEREFAILYTVWLGKSSLLKKNQLSRDLNEVRVAGHVDMQKSILGKETSGRKEVATLAGK